MDVKCGFCNLGEEASICGSLHCDKDDNKMIAAHHKCMQYSALLVQYKSEQFGGFKLEKVKKELARARKLPCSICKRKGASAGCAWASCRRGYHFPCAFNHAVAITKRYKVQSGSKTVILYRVFCSSEHEQAYRQNIKVSGFGKSSPEKQKLSQSESSSSSQMSKPFSTESERRSNRKHSNASDSENDDEQQEGLDRTNMSIASADLNETTSSLLDSPRMSQREVVEETQKEYLLLKRKRNAEDENSLDEKRPRLSENKNNSRSDSPSLLSPGPRWNTRSRRSPIGVDGAESESNHYDLRHSLSPEASDNDSDHSDDSIVDVDKETDSNCDRTEVILVIPSLLKVPDSEMEEVYKELGITQQQPLVWPTQDRASPLQDRHMPHIMWNIVEAIKNEEYENLKSILSNSSGEKYEYFLNFHSQDSNNVTQQVFHSLAEKLTVINSKQRKKVGQLISRKYQKMKILILYLSESCSDQKNIIACLQNSLFECGLNTVINSHKKTNKKLEFEKLWKWFRYNLKARFQIDTCPIEEVFLSDNYSSEVTAKLIDKLSAHKHCSSFSGSSTTTAVLAIDSANRDILKYEFFVKKAIKRFYDYCWGEIFCIVSVEKGDNIRMIEDILPPHLVGRAKVYTAINPEEYFVSCIVIHFRKGDAKVKLRKEVSPAPNSSERKFYTSAKQAPPASDSNPVVKLAGSANLRSYRAK